MHAILSRLIIGCYAYSAICIRITILISRAPPLTIVGRARGSAGTAAPCHVCSTVHAALSQVIYSYRYGRYR